jgi:hypothetical protein
MRRWLIVIAVLGLGFAQESPRFQNKFSFRVTPDIFPLSLESWISKPQSMWYADIPEDVHFYMQFVEVPEGMEFFIYPSLELPRLEDMQILPELEKP